MNYVRFWLDRRLTSADKCAIYHLHLDKRRRQEECTQGTFSQAARNHLTNERSGQGDFRSPRGRRRPKHGPDAYAKVTHNAPDARAPSTRARRIASAFPASASSIRLGIEAVRYTDQVGSGGASCALEWSIECSVKFARCLVPPRHQGRSDSDCIKTPKPPIDAGYRGRVMEIKQVYRPPRASELIPRWPSIGDHRTEHLLIPPSSGRPR